MSYVQALLDYLPVFALRYGLLCRTVLRLDTPFIYT